MIADKRLEVLATKLGEHEFYLPPLKGEVEEMARELTKYRSAFPHVFKFVMETVAKPEAEWIITHAQMNDLCQWLNENAPDEPVIVNS